MPDRPPEIAQLVHIRSVHGGMVDRLEPWLIEESQSALLQNVDNSVPGRRRRRRGVSSLGGRTDAPLGIWTQPDETLQQEAIWGAWGGHIYVLPGAGVVTPRASQISLTSQLHQFVSGRYQARAATYFCSAGLNDSDPSLATLLAVVSENNLVTQVASIAPRCAEWFQGRLWIGDNVRNQDDQSVWWSELNDGTLFSNLNAVRPEPGVGGRVTALFAVRGFTPAILAFKERATTVIEPFWGATSKLIPAAADALDTIKSSIRLISKVVGCVAPKSIQFVPGMGAGDVLFLANDGVRAVQRGSDDAIAGISEPLTTPIVETIRRINFAFARKCTSAVVDRHYYLSVPLDGATECTHVLDLDLNNTQIAGAPAWTVHDWNAKDLVASRANNEAAERLWMQYNESTGDCSVTSVTAAFHVFECLTGQLDPSGLPVAFIEDTRAFDMGTLTDKKRWDAAVFTVRNDSLVTTGFGVAYSVDGMELATAGSFHFGGTIDDPILGVTPLPWGGDMGVVRVFRLSLADAPPGYFMQLRVMGHSDLGDFSILDVAVAGRPVLLDWDNEIG